MAYDELGAWHWNELLHASHGVRDQVGWRFPLELAPDVILSPHLYGWAYPRDFAERGTRRHYDEFYTLTEVPEWVLYACGSEAQGRFVCDEIAPLLPPGCRLVVLDCEQERFCVLERAKGPWRPMVELPGLLNRWLGQVLLGPHVFDRLDLPWGLPRLAPSMYTPSDVVVRQLERSPIRLWEAFFARGHFYRWELIRGEVPLVVRFPTALAANRSLLQCVKDAERLDGEPAKEAAGWIETSRFRMRHRDVLLDIRARLSPADVRVAFMPTSELPGSRALPSLLGVLCAGGDHGKSEMAAGYIWSRVETALEGETSLLAETLRQTVLRWVEAPRVVVAPGETAWPRYQDGTWQVAFGGRSLTLFTPMYRESFLPVEVWHPRYEQSVGPVLLVVRHPRADDPALEQKVGHAFQSGARQVWLVRDGEQPRVEIREPGCPARVALPGDRIDLPGVLRKPVQVEALFNHWNPAVEAAVERLRAKSEAESEREPP